MPSVSVETRRRPADEPSIELEPQPQRERCPRCDSTDTKFCYYNNYNTSQPRHFCKSCRRYWTLGGSLRNVPIGGSTRKRLRPSPIPSQISKSNRTSLFPPLAFGSNGLLNSPLAGLSVPLPFLHSRVGFELGLGLGSRSGSGPGSDCLNEMGLGFGPGNGPVMWPVSMINEEAGMMGNGDTWKMESGRVEVPMAVPPAMGIWQELAMSAPVETSSGPGAHPL
ncbi:hypothetical protein LUZ61_014661 [Rhynchospora tenuis]|uniref:Dof zinc finger protein n=1 Tax=Rhynchospora tenuis TaxID=198213 RepID=A0AAD5WBI4_9POAL|nr:hypothetical protein LUZ61_014661 [Rhynchospora tenuis]